MSASDKHASQTRTALTVLAFCFTAYMLVRGVQEAYAVFLLPISEEFGWGRAGVSSVYSVTFLTVGLSGPVIGWLFDRFGPLRVYLFGAIAAGLGCLLAGQVQTLWQFYLVLGLLLGFASASVGPVTMTALLRRWFQRRLNTALAVALSSHGMGMLAIAPASQFLIDQFGWRIAYATLGGAIVLLLLPPLLLLPWRKIREGHPLYDIRPVASSDTRAASYGPTAAQAFRTLAFWGIVLSFFFTSAGMFSVVLQAPAYLIETGYAPSAAASAFGLVGLLLPGGMIGFGWLGDRIGRRRAVLISYGGTLSGVAMLALLKDGPNLLWLSLFVVMFGGTLGSRGPAISTIAATLFGGSSFGRIYGFVTVGMGFGGAFGAFLGGFLHDFTGGYLVGQLVAIAMIAAGAAPFVLIREITRV